jgi:hypothetical protein
MTKQEFDKASTDAGFGSCAEYMWDEIEECYSTSDEIDRALMVDIYWYEPGVYREILKLRRDIADGEVGIEIRSKGYRFPETRGYIAHLANLWKQLDEVITEAKRRMKARRK